MRGAFVRANRVPRHRESRHPLSTLGFGDRSKRWSAPPPASSADVSPATFSYEARQLGKARITPGERKHDVKEHPSHAVRVRTVGVQHLQALVPRALPVLPKAREESRLAPRAVIVLRVQRADQKGVFLRDESGVARLHQSRRVRGLGSSMIGGAAFRVRSGLTTWAMVEAHEGYWKADTWRFEVRRLTTRCGQCLQAPPM